MFSLMAEMNSAAICFLSASFLFIFAIYFNYGFLVKLQTPFRQISLKPVA
jgi:hypothetical protein